MILFSKKKVQRPQQRQMTEYLAQERARVYDTMRRGGGIPKHAPLEYVIECLWDEMSSQHRPYATHD